MDGDIQLMSCQRGLAATPSHLHSFRSPSVSCLPHHCFLMGKLPFLYNECPMQNWLRLLPSSLKSTIPLGCLSKPVKDTGTLGCCPHLINNRASRGSRKFLEGPGSCIPHPRLSASPCTLLQPELTFWFFTVTPAYTLCLKIIFKKVKFWLSEKHKRNTAKDFI